MEKISDFVTLTPAYGRDYTSATHVKEAFRSGKDFLIQDIRYGFDCLCSIQDFAPGCKVALRYRGKREVTILRV